MSGSPSDTVSTDLGGFKNPTWKAVSAVIDAFQDSAKIAPLAEDELVESAKDFANKPTAMGFFTLVTGQQLSGGVKPEYRELVDRVVTEEYEPQRAQMIADLDAVAAGSPPDEIAERAKQAASRMLLLPAYDFTDGALRVRHRYLTEDLDARLAYVTLLLLDSSRPYGKRLCRCKLDGCGVFFWERRADKGGKPGRSYCSKEHMQQFNDARAVERVRRYREKKRRAKRKGKAQ